MLEGLDFAVEKEGIQRKLFELKILDISLLDYTSFDQSANEDMSTVLYTLLVTFLCACLLFGFFAVNRMYRGELYTPLASLHPERCPPKLSNSDPYSWVMGLAAIDDATILEKGGYDILAFIRFYRFNFRLFAVFAAYAWIVLLPVNATGDMKSMPNVNVNSFQVWSMSNIPSKMLLLVSRIWYHFIVWAHCVLP